MKFSITHMTRLPGVALALALVLASGAAVAGLTGVAQVPLLSIENTGTVKPNLMVVYDNSGSMAFTVTPDYVDDTPSCRTRESMNAGGTMSCAVGHPPYHSADFNKQYYNPAVVYAPPVKSTGGYYPNITSFSAVKNDAYDINTAPLRGSGTTTNLVTDFPDLAWCKDANNCLKNTATTGYKYPDAVYYNLYITKTKTVNDVSNVSGAPYYYTIGVSEYCKTANLTDCKTTAVGAAAPANYPYPAKVRWCKKKDLATCQAKYIQSKTTNGVTDVGFMYPRFGDPAVVAASFVRTDIIATRKTYPRVKERTDCVAATDSCSYDEEMGNFANWYTYYRTRNQAMKTAVGLAFNPVNGNYNAGLVGLAQAAAITENTAQADLFARPLPFTGDARIAWYNTLYGMTPGGATPLRLALNTVGKMYASQKPFDKGTAAVQYPCQQNFTFLTTDGLWNGAVATGVANNDNKEDPSRFCTKAKGCVDPRSQNDASLADIALYWYNGGSNTGSVSLRPDLEDMSKEGLVKGPKGDNQRLHMNTYTLGLGVDGLMKYEPNYDTAPTAGGDFSNVVNGVSSGCPWNNNGAYVWPDAETQKVDGSDTIQSRVDDLWHTAINGRGKYFSAADPTEVIAGLKTALSFIDSTVGAASSAATSTPNITLADNDIFSNTFTTVQWSGELTKKKVNVVTGAVGQDVMWSTSKTLGTRVGAQSDTRIIKMLDPVGKTLKDFTFANVAPADKVWFEKKCSILAQCTKMTDADKAIVNQGATIVNWLRGQSQYADNVRLRAYGKGTDGQPLVLGDIASSKPAYVRVPSKNYAIPGYADFVIDNTATPSNPKRKAAVYVGANDGMLHAFDAASGAENWAYVPRITMKKLAFQASTDYGTNHQYTTDGSPEVADVQINGAWRSVLVAGLNAGGRGYYALDVTEPDNPKPLWETCADNSVCTGDNFEPELGLTFGNAQMGMWKDAVGKSRWVVFVASGYNNVPDVDGIKAGSGKAWLMILDVATGRVLEKVATPVQKDVDPLTTPAGLARITGISLDPATDPNITYIYGGDNLGQMWRFDLTKGGKPTVTRMGNAGVTQPITTRPDVTMCKVETVAADKTVTTSNKVVVVFPTGRLLDVADISNKDTQSLYVMRDSATDFTDTWRGASMARRPVTKTSSKNAPDVYTVSGTTVDLSKQAGWYTDFDQNKGERVTVDPKIVTGSLNIVSNVPDASAACTVGGKSNLYQFDVCSGTGALNTADGANGENNLVGGTLSSSSAAVGFIVIALPNGAKKIIATLADGSQVVVPAGDLKDPVSRRTGWRRIKN